MNVSSGVISGGSCASRQLVAHPHVQRVGHLRPLERLRGAGTTRTAASPRDPGSSASCADRTACRSGPDRWRRRRREAPSRSASAASSGRVARPAGSTISTARSVPRTPDSSVRGCGTAGAVQVGRALVASGGAAAVPPDWIRRVAATTPRAPLTGDALPLGSREVSRGPWDHERPVRRGVTAAPRILVRWSRFESWRRSGRSGGRCTWWRPPMRVRYQQRSQLSKYRAAQ